MKREELKAMDACTIVGMEFYEKSEADSVMDAMEARIVEIDEDYRKISEMYIAEQTKAAKHEQRIKELESQLENVQASMYAENVDANMSLIKANERIKKLEAENARLKDQVPKWHNLTKPLYTEDGVDYYDLPAEHGEYIIDCGGKECTHSEYDPDYNDWCNLISTAKVLRWCEFPTTEKSSETEKENG